MALRGKKRLDEYRKHRVIRNYNVINTLENNFYKNVKLPLNEDGCMNWIGASRCGYGRFRNAGKHISAHRYSYELYNGYIKNGLIVMHKCDNKSCVRPDHLSLGTAKDNNNDRDKKGRFTLLHSELNGNSKLTNNQVKEIKSKLNNGVKGNILAQEYAISPHTISKIKTGKLWRHLSWG